MLVSMSVLWRSHANPLPFDVVIITDIHVSFPVGLLAPTFLGCTRFPSSLINLRVFCKNYIMTFGGIPTLQIKRKYIGDKNRTTRVATEVYINLGLPNHMSNHSVKNLQLCDVAKKYLQYDGSTRPIANPNECFKVFPVNRHELS